MIYLCTINPLNIIAYTRTHTQTRYYFPMLSYKMQKCTMISWREPASTIKHWKVVKHEFHDISWR